MSACPTCGASPCIIPSFCAACRDADRRQLKAHFEGEKQRSGASQATVEALMWSLRERGTKALEEPGTKRRLSELNNQQVIEVGNRLQRLKPEIARAWSTTEVETLFQARIEQ
jgi:transposase